MGELNKTQWKKRVNVFQALYSCLVHKPPLFDVFKLTTTFSFEAEQIKILEFVKENLSKLVKLYEKNMDAAWTFDRLNYVEQAILLEAIAEKTVLNTDKKVLIDQAVISAKNYCDEESYKFINGILDKVL